MKRKIGSAPHVKDKKSSGTITRIWNVYTLLLVNAVSKKILFGIDEMHVENYTTILKIKL